MQTFANHREEREQSLAKVRDPRPRVIGDNHLTPVEGATSIQDERAGAEVAAAIVVDAAVTAQVEATSPVAPTTKAKGR